MTDLVVIDAINKSLKLKYRVFDGRPLFRVVWSNDQLEIRKGTYTDWYGTIMIRQEYQAVREVKKYWYLKTPCWVLEKLVFINGVQALKDIQEELVNARNGVYETLYAFQKEDGTPLPVVHDIIEFIIHAVHNPKKLTESDYYDIEKKQEQSEVSYFEEQLGQDARSDLFVFENSSFVSSNQLKWKKENQYIEPLNQIEGVSNGPVVTLS
jgi:hypothetical protein